MNEFEQNRVDCHQDIMRMIFLKKKSMGGRSLAHLKKKKKKASPPASQPRQAKKKKKIFFAHPPTHPKKIKIFFKNPKKIIKINKDGNK